MFLEEYEREVKKRRSDLENAVFNQSPKTIDDFRESKGRWMGLGEALSILEGMKKKEQNDD